MESLSLCITSSSPLSKPHKTTPKTPQIPPKIPTFLTSIFHTPQSTNLSHSTTSKTPLKPHISLPTIITTLSYSTLPSLASDIPDPTVEIPERINLEAIVTSIDGFFNKYPFFVAGVTFIWLIVVPLAEEYFNKYKFVSALDAFKKLRDDPCAQLLDVRDEKSVRVLSSPSLRMFSKDVVQVSFEDGDEDGFVKRVLEKFADPKETIVCILDNFDGNSLKVAELLFKSGFKEAYAIKGGVRGNKGWKEIQQEFLPPSVHVISKKKSKKSQYRGENGAVTQPDAEQVSAATSEK